jgi:NADH-quinone oxidoreductase subunit N
LTAASIWIAIAGLIGVLLLLINRWHRLATLIGISSCTLLALLILIVPVGEAISIAGLEFQISGELNILGRQVIIAKDSVPIIFIVYMGAAFWIGFNYLAQSPRIFPGVAVIVSALLVGALTVEPFLYAAMIIELIALIFVPLLVQPGRTAGRGMLRFISFLTLGMPFLLLAGWILTGNELGTNPFDQNNLAALLLGIGFIFLLAIFPFHSWVPMVMEETHPFTGAFVIFFLSQAALFFVHGLAQRYGWIEQSVEFALAIRFAGLLIISINGFFLAFQRDLGRILGFYILAESGYALLALSDPSEAMVSTFYALAIVRMLGFSLVAYCISHLARSNQSLRFTALKGAFHSHPWCVSGVILGQLCMLGLPLLAGFPVKIVLFQQFTGENLFFYSWIFVGIAGTLVVTLRSLVHMVAWQPEFLEDHPETRLVKMPILLCSILLVLIGLIPGLSISILISLLQM